MAAPSNAQRADVTKWGWACGLTRVVDTARRELRFVYAHEGTPSQHLRRIEVWASAAAEPEQQSEPATLQTWVDYAQDESHCLASAADALGNTERYRYDGARRMVQVTLPNGTSFYYLYEEAFGRCIKTWGDGGLHTVELERRPGGEVFTTGNPEPRRYVYTEDGYTLVEETPDGGSRRERSYDADRYVLSEQNAAGETYSFVYDDRGHRTSLTDPAGNTQAWEYAGDLPRVHTNVDGHATRYSHDERGALVAAEYATGERYTIAYDAYGRVVGIYDNEGLRFSFAYDAHHNLAAQHDARGATTRFSYDALGRPLARQDALGRVTRVDYDRIGQPLRIVHADETATHASYDALGNVCRYVDGLGQSTEMGYGGTGVLLELTEPTGQKWRFTYDKNERLLEIENPRAERYRYAYDWSGRIVEERPFDGRTLRYSYNKSERLSRIDRADATFRAFLYDKLGNVVEERSTDGGVRFARDAVGRLLGATVEEGDGRDVVTTFERDTFGRITAEVQDGSRIAYALDARGRVMSRTLPEEAEGQVTSYAYDRLGAATRVTHQTPHGSYAVDITRDALGREVRRSSQAGALSTAGAAAAAARPARLEMLREYDAMDRLIRQHVSAPEPGVHVRALSDRAWRYDSNGRPTDIHDARWGSTSYRYDPLGQLLEARRGGQFEVFDYDPAGSLRHILTEATASAGGANQQPWQLERGNVLTDTGDTHYDNDSHKRRTRKTETLADGTTAITEYRWDIRDRLREVRLPDGRRASYRYDAFARRTEKGAPGYHAEG